MLTSRELGMRKAARDWGRPTAVFIMLRQHHLCFPQIKMIKNISFNIQGKADRQMNRHTPREKFYLKEKDTLVKK